MQSLTDFTMTKKEIQDKKKKEDKLHRMAYDAYMKSIFFTEQQKSYIQGFKDGYSSQQKNKKGI